MPSSINCKRICREVVTHIVTTLSVFWRLLLLHSEKDIFLFIICEVKMSDFPRGGDVQATKAWLDQEGLVDAFEDMKADDLLRKSDEFVNSKFSEADERADTVRQLTGNLTTHVTCNIPIFNNVSDPK
jgi:hypothetical protein